MGFVRSFLRDALVVASPQQTVEGQPVITEAELYPHTAKKVPYSAGLAITWVAALYMLKAVNLTH